jgi:3-hydroxyisobutyrate dehydrogenase-like beta-hydroxyacid dehydrogenase
MNKVAIVGLGWVGMPLALSLLGRGYRGWGVKPLQMALKRPV